MSTNRSLKQWIDLGIHTEACMTRPEICGVAGGAFSVWINIIDCQNNTTEGLITTIPNSSFTGFHVQCGSGGIILRYICQAEFWLPINLIVRHKINEPHYYGTQVCIAVVCVPPACLPYPWGSASGGSASRGVCPTPGGGSAQQPSGLPTGGGLHPGVGADSLPTVNRMTYRCKNVTLPQTSFAGAEITKQIICLHENKS